MLIKLSVQSTTLRGPGETSEETELKISRNWISSGLKLYWLDENWARNSREGKWSNAALDLYQPAYGNVPGHIFALRRQAGDEPTKKPGRIDVFALLSTTSLVKHHQIDIQPSDRSGVIRSIARNLQSKVQQPLDIHPVDIHSRDHEMNFWTLGGEHFENVHWKMQTFVK